MFHQKGHAFVIFWASLQLFNTAMIRRIFSVLMQNDILISVVETLLFLYLGICDCDFGYCRWPLLFCLMIKEEEEDDDDDDEDDGKKQHRKTFITTRVEN